MSIYRTTCWGQDFAVKANWTESPSPVFQETSDGWVPFQGKQVADFQHDGLQALLAVLEHVAETGTSIEEEEEAINKAIARAEEE